MRGVTGRDGVAVAVLSVAALMLAMTGSAGATNTTPTAMPASSASKVTFEPATFADLPGWESDDHLAALKTFLMSCGKVMASESAGVPESASAALARTCRAAASIETPTRKAARAFFEEQFVPHRVVHPTENGLLTGYYEPVLKGSRKPQGRFQTPVYRRPPDLVNVVAETQRASMADGFSHVRQTDKGVEPFPTRAEIEQGALKGQGLELVYLADPVDTFFMHIQGSGRIELTDGSTMRLNYDGKNGHPYTSIGRYLIDHKLCPANRMSMQALRKWLNADRARGQRVMWQNKSFIFFRELKGHEADGPMGAMSVPLTAGRSLAVDTAFHTLGTPIYVASPSLKHATQNATKSGGFNRLMVAQDVGSAIKGPERGDIYFGSGAKAGKLAGITKNQGTFYALLPSPEPKAVQALERFTWPKIDRVGR